MKKRNKVLSRVKVYIDINLNPSTKSFYDPCQDSYEPALSTDKILGHIELVRPDYEEALSVSDDDSFFKFILNGKSHALFIPKSTPNSCIVNSYFADGFFAWEANFDIQPVFNHYKAISYMWAYLSNSKDESSHAMQEAVKDAFTENLDDYNQLKSIVHACTNKTECSVQESVYHVLPGRWLKKTFSGIAFANSNIPEIRLRVCLKEEEISYRQNLLGNSGKAGFSAVFYRHKNSFLESLYTQSDIPFEHHFLAPGGQTGIKRGSKLTISNKMFARS